MFNQCKVRIHGLLGFIVRNFLLFFQIYAIVYVFINSYINQWFSLNRETFFEFEKVIVINFFQAEILFLYLFYKKMKNNNKSAELKAMYLNYLQDMERQGINKKKASVYMLIAVLILGAIFGLLIWKSPFGGFINLVIGLNEIMINNIEIGVPCLLFAVFLFLQIKNGGTDRSLSAHSRLGAIMYSFRIAIPIFIVLFVARILFSGKTEDSFVPAGLLAINLSFLITIIKQKSFSAINSKS